MAYPGPNVHRASRRKLGRGQYPTVPAATATLIATGAVATLHFDRPVVVSGNIPTVVPGHALLSQTNSTPTSILQYFGTALAGLGYSIAANPATVRTTQGGGVGAVSGTF